MKTSSKTFFALLFAALTLTGCFKAAPVKVPDNGSYEKRTLKDGTVVETTRSSYAIQADDMKDSRAAVKPIFELEALEGQTISLSGVKRMAVYAPQANTTQQLAAPQRELSGWEKSLVAGDRLLERGLQIFGIVSGRQVAIRQIEATRDIALSRDQSTVDLVGKITKGNAEIAGFITQPAPNVTTTYNAGRDLNAGGTQANQNNPVQIACSSGSTGQGGQASATDTPPATGAQANAGSSGPSGAVTCR